MHDKMSCKGLEKRYYYFVKVHQILKVSSYLSIESDSRLC